MPQSSTLDKLLATLASLAGLREPFEQSSPQPPRLLQLPWDVRRLIFEKASSIVWRGIPVGYLRFYYASLSQEASLLQVSRSVNAEANFAMQNYQADQPCVLAIGPRYFGVVLVLLNAIAAARTYDETHLRTVPRDEKPSLSINKRIAELPFDDLKRSVARLNHEALNTFIT
jgi:hypothetical protein